jgi:tetratricopeptide (TPR) repeat protein
MLLICAATAVHAAGKGQDDLDNATDIKLNATTLSDLSEVIRLGENAMKKGLDKESTEFAVQLLASTYIQRAHQVVKQMQTGRMTEADFLDRRNFALNDLQQSIKLNPNQPEGYLLLAELNLMPGGDVKLARESLDKALSMEIEDALIRVKALTWRAGLEKNADKKMADMNEAVKLSPKSADVVRKRGLMLADMNKLELALEDLNKAIELDPKNGPTFEAQAIVLARLKKFDLALAALDKARKINPDSVMPLVQRARVHTAQENLDAAIIDLDQALNIDPENAAVLLMRSGIYQEMGKKDKALADADHALKIKPDYPPAVRTRVLLLADARRFDEAVGELEKLLKSDPKDALSLLQLAMLYGAQKKAAKSIETYTSLLALAPEEWRGLRGRGDAYLNAGKQAEAIADYEKALKLMPKEPDAPPSPTKEKNGTKTKDKESASTPSTATATASPEKAGILNNLAWVLATSPNEKIRNGKRAIELATEACKLTDYKTAYILSTLAASYAETGDFDSAVKWSTKAVEIGDKGHDESLKKELESYKAKKPWRELLSEDKPAEK